MSWPMVSLGELVEVLSGFAFKSDKFNASGEGLPLVRIRDVKGGKSETYYSGEFTERFVVSDGDLLVGMDGEFNCAPWRGGRALLNQRVCRVTATDHRMDQDYLRRFLPTALKVIEARTSFVTVKHLSSKDIAAIQIPLPPLPEQRRIAAILDQADALRRLRRQSLSRLSDLGQAIFFEMFGDAASNPRSWPTIRLGDLCTVGSSKRVFVSEFAESGVPFYRGTEVGQLGAGKPIDPDLFISTQHYERLIAESGRPAIGDLLLPSICHDGRIWLVNDDRPFYFKDGRVLWIKSANAEVDGEYLRRNLQGIFMRDYGKIASGTTFAELKIVNLKSLQISYPPLDLQRQFAEKMSALERTRGDSLGAIDMIDSLFSSLHHRAFCGEL